MEEAPGRIVSELSQACGLKGTDIADLLGVSAASVLCWASGANEPPPRAQLILSDLHHIVARLQQYYSAHEIRAWLYAGHPQAGGRRAVDLVSEGRPQELLDILDRLDAEVYL